MQTTQFVVFQLANFFLFFFSGKYLISTVSCASMRRTWGGANHEAFMPKTVIRCQHTTGQVARAARPGQATPSPLPLFSPLESHNVMAAELGHHITATLEGRGPWHKFCSIVMKKNEIIWFYGCASPVFLENFEVKFRGWHFILIFKKKTETLTLQEIWVLFCCPYFWEFSSYVKVLFHKSLRTFLLLLSLLLSTFICHFFHQRVAIFTSRHHLRHQRKALIPPTLFTFHNVLLFHLYLNRKLIFLARTQLLHIVMNFQPLQLQEDKYFLY